MATSAQLVLVDAHFADRKNQAFGHGSQEHAAAMARTYGDALLLATHHGASATDTQIRDGYRRHGQGASNFRLARDRDSYRWNPSVRRFVAVRAARRSGPPAARVNRRRSGLHRPVSG